MANVSQYDNNHPKHKKKYVKENLTPVTFKKSSLVFLVQGEQLSGGLSYFSERVLHAPYFTLVSQTKLSNKFQLLVQTFLLEGTSWSCVGFTPLDWDTTGHFNLKYIPLCLNFCKYQALQSYTP